MSLRRLLLPTVALVLGTAAIAGTQLSGASYVTASTSTVSIAAANDWTPPTVSMTDPGAAISGSTVVAATATDARSAVASVRIEYAASGSNSWTTLCTDTTSPYTCAWTTTAVADGSYDLRAAATDTAGYSASSDTVTTRVVNTAAVVLTDPGDNLAGAFSLTARYLNGVPGGTNLNFEYSANGTSWSTVPGCTKTTTTYVGNRTCAVSYLLVASGSYDFRAVASGNGQTTSLYDYASGITVDNTAPTTTLNVPTGILSGTVNLGANPSDADSGVASVAFQYQLVGSLTWITFCTAVDVPWTCSLKTTSLANGSYNLQAIPTDYAGNVGAAAMVASRTVDNSVPTVSVTTPTGGTTVRGAVALSADAASTKGVTSVRFDVRLPGAGSWTTVCTDTVSPYSCTWDSTVVTTGNVDVRAVLLDGGNVSTTSATVTVAVDNSVLHALDVQAVNTVTAGRPASGDQLVLTYSAVVNPATVIAGWDGTAKSVTVTFADKAASGSANAGYDNITVDGTNLGSVALTQNYVKPKKATTFVASMVAATTTVNGTSVTVLTVTLGGGTGASNLRTVTAADIMSWTPSILVKTAAGLACSTATATESGIADRDW